MNIIIVRFMRCLLLVASIIQARAQTYDPTFGVAGNRANDVLAIAVQPDGRILMGGVLTSIENSTRTGLARLLPSGALDAAFECNVSPYASGSSPAGSVLAICVHDSGDIFVSGGFPAIGGVSRSNVARVSPSGVPYNTAGTDPQGLVWCLTQQDDGKVLAGGRFNSLSGGACTNLGRMNADGSLDPTFRAEIPVSAFVYVVAQQEDGKILVSAGGLRRLNANGSLDATFPVRVVDIRSIVVQPDKKIIIAGEFNSLGGGAVTNIARLNYDGSVDATFSTTTSARVNCVALQCDGSMFVGGEFLSANGQIVKGLCRFNKDGALDTTFLLPDFNSTSSIFLQRDGKVLVTTPRPAAATTNISRFLNNVPAGESLVFDAGARAFKWLRYGSAPEVSLVRFEVSKDSSTWTNVEPVTRIEGGWSASSAGLPHGTYYVRARGRVNNGLFSASSSPVESSATFTLAPAIVRPVVTPEGGFQFEFQATAGASFTVLGTTNPLLPAAQWNVLGQASALGGGTFRFTDPSPAAGPQRFYRLRSE